MDPDRRLLPTAASEGLRQRYLTRQTAERDLTSFLSGVVLALEIDPERVTGFDDATSELLLEPDEEPLDET